MQSQAITILEFNQRLSQAVAAAPGLRNVWVVGETSDLKLVKGHCYFELVQKDERGSNVSKIKAFCWGNVWNSIILKFQIATGAVPASGMKLMLCVSATYHPAYGMQVTVSDINPAYTLGDAVRRRNEIIQRLQREGLTELNRNLRWAIFPNRVAVISSSGAAGYGDFINQLYNNPYCLNFRTYLFQATMQGGSTVPTVMECLRQIGEEADSYDCVVIIRGGGATTDLAAFDSYELAAEIARFPLPVIVGIGHERDITVLDYVANMRVKTPTAAAEWLIGRGKRLLDALANAAQAVVSAATQAVLKQRRQLDVLQAKIPGALQTALLTASRRLDRSQSAVENLIPTFINPQKAKLDTLAALVEALSPQAVLARGFTMTYLPDGTVATSVDQLAEGVELTTAFADGQSVSTVKSIEPRK